MIWVQLALFVVSFLISAYLAPRPQIENARASKLDDLRFPQAEEGSPIALALGKVRIRAPNSLWYGDFRTKEITKKVKSGPFSSKRVTVGHKYYVGYDLGLCLGPDVRLRRFWIDKKEVWAGDVGPGESAISISKPSLFGGEEKGGGFSGTLRFYGGSFSQVRNAYLASKLDADVPAYNGLAHLVFEQVYIGTAAQLRPMSFEVERYTNGLGLSSLINRVGDDLNPMEILYQLLTSRWGGLDVEAGDIDVTSFNEAAKTLADEGNGMSLLVTRANGGKDAIDEVLRQIDGILYQDPVTGKIALSLIRHDYLVGDLPVFDTGNILAIRAFNRTSWEDTVNQVRVTYANRDRKYEKGVAMVQDMANINQQGRLRSTNISFPGCHSGTLAVKLATRDMTQLSVPLYKATLEVNRQAAQLRPGDPFVLSWPEYGLSQVVMRVQRFNLGELVDGRIVLEAVQDRFATNETVFAPPDNTLFQPIDRSAQDVVSAHVTEAPYWLMQQQQIVDQPAADRGYPLILARQPGIYQQGYSATVADTLMVDHVPFTPTASLVNAIGALDGFADGTTSVTIESPRPGSDWLAAASVSQVRQGYNLFAVNGELMAYQTLTDNGDGTWTLGTVTRALLDTVQIAHAATATVFFINIDGLGTGDIADTTTFSALIQSYTDNDETPLASAPAFSHTPNRRYARPHRPAYLRFNSSRTPATVTTTGPHTVDWRPRSRLHGDVAFESDAAHTEEAGVTYTLRFYLDGTLQSGMTQSGLTTPSAEVTFSSPTSGQGRFQVTAVRDGLESYNANWLEVSINV